MIRFLLYAHACRRIWQCRRARISEHHFPDSHLKSDIGEENNQKQAGHLTYEDGATLGESRPEPNPARALRQDCRVQALRAEGVREGQSQRSFYL